MLVVNGETVAYFSLVDQRELSDQAGVVWGSVSRVQKNSFA